MSMRCDFCFAPDARWVYWTKEFEEHLTVLKRKANLTAEEGGWAACEACSELIEQEDLKGLTKRAASIYVKRHELPPHWETILSEQLLKIYLALFTARKGRREEVKKDESGGS
jgi:hypothetical protein